MIDFTECYKVTSFRVVPIPVLENACDTAKNVRISVSEYVRLGTNLILCNFLTLTFFLQHGRVMLCGIHSLYVFAHVLQMVNLSQAIWR